MRTKRKTTSFLEEKEKARKIINRISRIEGQLRGVRKMIEDEKGCLDIITQINAVKEAVSKLGVELLKNDFCKIDLKKGIDDKYIETLFKIK
jgi:CsoR family transcriptional regulator, copper-sensing transcriptional repressor